VTAGIGSPSFILLASCAEDATKTLRTNPKKPTAIATIIFISRDYYSLHRASSCAAPWGINLPMGCNAPLALNPNVGLIHPPTVVSRSEPRSQSTLNLWGVTLDPPPDGDVVDQKSTLSKESSTSRYDSEKRKYQPTASRIIAGSNWRHLNRPATEGSRTISAQLIKALLQSCNTSPRS
jgi:hypothetical protein